MGGWGSSEDLGGVEGVEAIIRVYYKEKGLFSVKKKWKNNSYNLHYWYKKETN